MAISKLVAGAKGAVGNSTGAEIAETVNGLIDGVMTPIEATDGKGMSFVLNSDVNYIDPSRSTNVITAAGRSDFPNKIGSPEKPLGTDRPNTDLWTEDTAYTSAPLSTATVAGVLAGYDHICNQIAGTIVGGGHNYMQYDPEGHSFIGGGSYNWIKSGRAVICGGSGNSVTDGFYGVIVGGEESTISGGGHNFIGAGYRNIISGSSSISSFNSILGGRLNVITGTAKNSTILGGRNNLVDDDFNAVASGEDAVSMGSATLVHSSGKISEVGDCQNVTAHQGGRTTGSSQLSLSAQGSFINFDSAKKSAAICKTTVIGIDEVSGSSCAYELEYMANWDGTNELLTTVGGSGTTLGMNIVADNIGITTPPAIAMSSGLLRPRVTGVDGKNIKWSSMTNSTMSFV